MAAAISYHVLFAIVPLAMFAVSLFGLIAGTEGVQERLVDETTEYLRLSGGDVFIELTEAGSEHIEATYGPNAAIAISDGLAALDDAEEEQLAKEIAAGNAVRVAGYEVPAEDLAVRADNLVAQTLRNVIDASAPIGVVSFLVLAYSAAGLFGALRRSLDFVWDVPAHAPFVQGKLVDVLLLLLSVFGLTVLLATSVAITGVLAALQLGGLLWSATWAVAPWFVTFLFCLLVFRFGPHVRNRFRDVWPGAALVATGFEVLKFGYAVYIINFSNYDVVYGALGGVLLFMLFVNLAAYLFLFGAELAAEYPRVSNWRQEPPPQDPRSWSALLRDAIRGLFVSKR